MQRITTGTADADLHGLDIHGTGRPGFVDGNAGIALPPTRLNAAFFNVVQEELARCVEGDGATVVPNGGTANYHQLDDAVRHAGASMGPRASASRYVFEGLEIEQLTGTDVILRPGRYAFDGREYVITGEKLVAAYPLSNFQITLAFGGTPANGDYVTTFDGFDLSSAVPVTTTRAAGVPSDNDALAVQHDTDISGEGDLSAVVGDVTAVTAGSRSDVEVMIGGGLSAGTITTSAPAGATLEVEYTGLMFSLDPTDDTYFYIAPEDPSDPADPPDRANVHIETIAVANGAAAPSTPAGTMLFAMVVTDGTDVTDVVYFNSGPAMLSGPFGAGLRMQPEPEPLVAAALVPHSLGVITPDIDIGEALPRGATAPDNSGYIRTVYSKRYTLLTNVSALQDRAIAERWSEIVNVGAGGTANVVLFDAADWPDGSSFYLEVKGAAIDPSDPTDGYSFRSEAHVHIDGTPTLDGTGGGSPPPFEGGAGGAAAGMDVNFSINSTDVRLTITGHGTDATRWHFTVEVVATGATP